MVGGAVQRVLSDSRSALEVLLDVLGVLAVEALQLLVELPVALVDVVDRRLRVEHPTTVVLVALLHSKWRKLETSTAR